MQQFDLYRDISMRTGGDIYIGVVGPVRTGKSTFITKFMQTLVLPTIKDAHRKKRVTDELPQSADGKTIMTTQPKFVPDEAQTVDLGDNLRAKVRLIDCVGYLVGSAEGHTEDGKPRLVDTPWSDEKMPFEKAAEFGTRKVMTDHSTIGIVVTSDGSVTELPRKAYESAEERIVNEMKELGKPFVIVLNTRKEKDSDSKKLATKLTEKYGVPVILQNVATMEKEELAEILKAVLMQFPVECVGVSMPKWLQALQRDNDIISDIIDKTVSASADVGVMGDYGKLAAAFEDDEYIEKIANIDVDFGKGKITLELTPVQGLFYSVLSKQCDLKIENDFELVSYIKSLGYAKKQYDKLADAVKQADEFGYGVVVPTDDDMNLNEPEIVKRGARYGVRLKASAPSYHIMKVDVETEVNPIMSEAQDENVLKEWLEGFGEDERGVWKTNMLGKSLDSIAKDGLTSKLASMPADTRLKLRKTVNRIVNEGKGGVLCILL